MDVLGGFSSLSLVVESFTYPNQLVHEFIFLTKICQQLMYVGLWLVNDAADELSHWYLEIKSIAHHIHGEWSRNKTEWCMDVPGISPCCILFYHETFCGTCLNYILPNHLHKVIIQSMAFVFLYGYFHHRLIVLL